MTKSTVTLNIHLLTRGIILSATLLMLALFHSSCSEEPDPTDSDVQDTDQSLPDTTGIPHFSGTAAFEMVEKQVAFGPRNPGSPGAAAALEFLVEELSKYAATVERQTFEHVGYDEEVFTMTNVIASFNPEATTRILLCAHWDTRPRADHDQDPEDRDKPILGANDGGSGVGVLLEFARVMKEHPPTIGVDIVLFDGEDYGDTRIDNLDRYFLGATYFSRNLPEGYRPAFGILLDIVGDHKARFRKEGYSLQYAPGVVETIWSAASQLGLSSFEGVVGDNVQDDHLPLNRIARIPTVDIIDADLVGNKSSDPTRRYWHTSDDTIDKISSETLHQVGRLLSYMVYRVVPAQLEQSGGTE